MSQIDSAEVTNSIEPCQSAESSLSNKASNLLYLKLAQTRITSFQWQEKQGTVAEAEPEVFDAFISEVVEEIVNVDRAVWNIYDRWNIINACLEAGVLLLTQLPEGLMLTYPEEGVE